MHLHRAQREPERHRNLLIAQPLGHQPEHVALAARETRRVVAAAQFVRGIGRDVRPPGVDAAHGVHALPRRHALEQQAQRTRVEGAPHLGVAAVGRDGDDARRGIEPPDRLDGLDAADDGQPDVHDDDVGPQALVALDRRPAVGGLAHDLALGPQLQHRPEPLAHHGVVVDDEDPDASGDALMVPTRAWRGKNAAPSSRPPAGYARRRCRAASPSGRPCLSGRARGCASPVAAGSNPCPSSSMVRPTPCGSNATTMSIAPGLRRGAARW